MNINVIGFGTMGRQIVALMSQIGCDVSVWNRQFVDSHQQQFLFEVKMLQRRLVRNWPVGRIRYVSELSNLKPALTVEVLAEDIEIKRGVLAQIPYSPGDNVSLVTNSSSYSPAEIHPSAIGLHFFNPIHALKFVELTEDRHILNDDVGSLIDRLEDEGFEIVRTSPNRGYVGNYILFREISSALRLVELHNYKSVTVDRVLSHMGRRVSLFDIIDLVGTDVVLRILENLRADDPSLYLPRTLNRAVDEGILGKKNGTSIRCLLDIES